MRAKNPFSNSYYTGSSETNHAVFSLSGCFDHPSTETLRRAMHHQKNVKLISSWLRPRNPTQNIWLPAFFFWVQNSRKKCIYLTHSWKEKDKYFNSNNRHFPHLIFVVIFWFTINGSIKVKYDFRHHAVVFFWCSGSLVLHTSHLTVP